MRFDFQVEEKPLPFSHHHGWVAVDASGQEISLPDGGTGKFLGSYPEIQQHLLSQHGVTGTLVYVRGRDDLDIDPGVSATWTFRVAGHEVIVRDIPRTIWRISVAS